MNDFTRLSDLVRGFSRAVNLISPEVQSHHEKVAYLAAQLADALQMDARDKRLAYFGALTHDIGGIQQPKALTLRELESNAAALATAGAAILRTFPATQVFSDIVRDSQTPWQRLRALPTRLVSPLRISQIIHMADAITLILDEKTSVLNQVARIRECIRGVREGEFSPEILGALDTLCAREYVWMDLLYNPQRFLDIMPVDRAISLDECVSLAGFMSRIIDFKSPFTAMHSAGVAATAVELARRMGMSETECKMMRIAGLLHDVGKLKVPNELLEKPGKLTDAEFNVVKEHAYYTYIILKDVRGFEQIAAWAGYHHEKLDGNGYPYHIRGEDLPLGARIMAVADIFSALTEDRPYRKGMERDRALAILRENAERGQLSPAIVELLSQNYDAINAARDQESKAASRKYQESLKESS